MGDNLPHGAELDAWIADAIRRAKNGEKCDCATCRFSETCNFKPAVKRRGYVYDPLEKANA